MEIYKIAIVTMKDEPDFKTHPSAADHLLAEALQKKGYEVNPVPWDRPDVDWKSYDAVVMRGCHDYVLKHQEFIDWVEFLRDNQIPLFNNPDLVIWNSNKIYLTDLAEKGVNVIPTVFRKKSNSENCDITLRNVMKNNKWDRMFIKPCIGCDSFQVKLISSEQEADDFQDQFNTWLEERDMMLQEYMPEARTNGEFSFVFFDNKLSHAILKKPLDGIRVTRGDISIMTPSKGMLDYAQKVLTCVDYDVMYARVDFVQRGKEFLLMELELIECELFLGYNPSSAEVFADLIVQKLKSAMVEQ